MSKRRKFVLDEDQMPSHYYNIVADMPNAPLPPLHPGTKQALNPEDLAPLFPQALIKQEMSREARIEIPEEVQDIYKLYRPSPLFRAYGLERALGTSAKLFYKYEGGSPSGSHKPNTAIAQAYYNAKEGVKRITTETGAGQWGSALSFACQHFGIDLEVYMVKLSYEQKPYRSMMMHTYGAEVYPSPSNRTKAGQAILAQDPESPGSLGIAISEAIERAAGDEHTKYALGSVLNHVLMHQTVIGQEAITQLQMADVEADIIIAPFGGGSNFAGLAFPFLEQNFNTGKKTRCIAVEPSSCPKLTQGKFQYDFGDTAGMTPLLPMYTLGHDFVPAKIHAGGLRYHGAGVLVSQLLKDQLIEAQAIDQLECFTAGIQFAKTEGLIAAPEAAHGIAAAIREAEKATREGTSPNIVFNLCGHGHFDLAAYEAYYKNELKNHALSKDELESRLKVLA